MIPYFLSVFISKWDAKRLHVLLGFRLGVGIGVREYNIYINYLYPYINVLSDMV